MNINHANIMNDTKDILKRLLKQFPVAKLREHFDIKAVGQENVIRDVLTSVGNNPATILKFAEIYFEHCKQHAHIFDYESKQPFPTDLKIQDSSSSFNSTINGKISYTYFIPVSFKGFYELLGSVVDVKFWCPVRIQYFFNSKSNSWILLLKITILEKTLNDDKGNKIFKYGKDFDEKELIISLTNELHKIGIEINKVDLTKGIKELLKNDTIDLPSAKYRKDKSITTEVMNEDYTIKKHLPEVYLQILNSPLEKSTCKFLDNIDTYLPYFRTEPQQGMIGFSIYSNTLESVDNVVNLVLDNNF